MSQETQAWECSSAVEYLLPTKTLPFLEAATHWTGLVTGSALSGTWATTKSNATTLNVFVITTPPLAT